MSPAIVCNCPQNTLDSAVSSRLTSYRKCLTAIRAELVRWRLDDCWPNVVTGGKSMSCMLFKKKFVVVICTDEHSKRHKRNVILKALSATPPDVATLRQLAISRGGLLDDCLRKRAWPCLLDIDVKSIPPKPGEILLTFITVSIFCGFYNSRA